MSADWLPLLVAGPALVGLATWLWRRRDRRDTDSSTGGTDFSGCTPIDTGWGADSDPDCSADGGGDGGGCGGD